MESPQSTHSIILGDPSYFAIQAGVDNVTTNIWGHMCVWCHGFALGDLNDLHCGLGAPADYFGRFNTDFLNSLWSLKFENLSDHQIWNLLDGMLYGYHGDVLIDYQRTLDQIKYDMREFGKFDFLTGLEEMFDGFKSFIFCPPAKRMRILCPRFPSELGLGVDVERKTVIEVASGFAQWYDEQYMRIKQP